jgi:uncharacterized membrane protein
VAFFFGLIFEFLCPCNLVPFFAGLIGSLTYSGLVVTSIRVIRQPDVKIRVAGWIGLISLAVIFVVIVMTWYSSEVNRNLPEPFPVYPRATEISIILTEKVEVLQLFSFSGDYFPAKSLKPTLPGILTRKY